MGLVELSVLFYLTGLPSKAVVRSPTFSSGSASPINDDITVTKTSSSGKYEQQLKLRLIFIAIKELALAYKKKAIERYQATSSGSSKTKLKKSMMMVS